MYTDRFPLNNLTSVQCVLVKPKVFSFQIQSENERSHSKFAWQSCITSVYGTSRGQYVMNHLHEVEDDQEEIEDDNNPPLSTQGDTLPHRAQLETP